MSLRSTIRTVCNHHPDLPSLSWCKLWCSRVYIVSVAPIHPHRLPGRRSISQACRVRLRCACACVAWWPNPSLPRRGLLFCLAEPRLPIANLLAATRSFRQSASLPACQLARRDCCCTRIPHRVVNTACCLLPPHCCLTRAMRVTPPKIPGVREGVGLQGITACQRRQQVAWQQRSKARQPSPR